MHRRRPLIRGPASDSLHLPTQKVKRRAEGKGSRMRRSMTNHPCHLPCPFASQKFRRRHRIHIQIRCRCR